MRERRVYNHCMRIYLNHNSRPVLSLNFLSENERQQKNDRSTFFAQIWAGSSIFLIRACGSTMTMMMKMMMTMMIMMVMVMSMKAGSGSTLIRAAGSTVSSRWSLSQESCQLANGKHDLPVKQNHYFIMMIMVMMIMANMTRWLNKTTK